jgi:hypothetical protein
MAEAWPSGLCPPTLLPRHQRKVFPPTSYPPDAARPLCHLCIVRRFTQNQIAENKEAVLPIQEQPFRAKVGRTVKDSTPVLPPGRRGLGQDRDCLPHGLRVVHRESPDS